MHDDKKNSGYASEFFYYSQRIEMSAQDIFLMKCVNEWIEEDIDERVEYALENIEDWTSGLDEEDDEIISELLNRFRYYSKAKVRTIIKELNQRMINKYGVSNADSLISVVRKSDGKINSSHEYWLKHREISQLSKDLYYDSLLDIPDKYWGNIKKIVFVDDCSGTGSQFTDFLERVEKSFINSKKTLKGKTIILLAVHIIEDALAYIQDYAAKHGLNIQVEYYWCERKAFHNSPSNKIKRFIEISNTRAVKNVRGYKNAEALMAFYNNSPNDTLGLFWCNTDNNKAIFPREDAPKAGWKYTNNQKKERVNQQYGAKAR